MIRVAIFGMTSNYGGIENVMINIYRNINRENIQFDFILLHNASKMAYEEEVCSLGGRVLRIMYSQRESLIKSKTRLFKYFKDNPEVKIVYLNTNYPYAFPLKVAKEAGVSTRIVHSHSSAMLFEDIEKGIKGYIKSLRNIMAYSQVKKYPNVYFACSDIASKATFKKDEYIWIKNGIEIEHFTYSTSLRAEVRKEYGILGTDTVIGMVGYLSKVKNPVFSLEVFYKYKKINKDSKMLIIGDGPYRRELEEKVKEYGIEDSVIFAGMVDNTSRLYNAMDMVLMPSLFEGFPITLIEAQTSGVKCLVSDTISKQVAITDLINFKSIEKSPQEWAKEIQNMLNAYVDRTKYAILMNKQGFDVSSMAEQVIKYFIVDNNKE